MCRFLVVPRGGPAALGIPDTGGLGILNMKFCTMQPRGHMGKINEQRIEVTPVWGVL